jgi:hypothetical protein
MDVHFASISGRAGRRIGKGCLPGGEIMGSEYDFSEEVTAARWHESPRSRRTTTKGDGIICKVVHDLVKELLREKWGSGDIFGGAESGAGGL